MPKPKSDFTQVAHRVFKQAIGEGGVTTESGGAPESPKARAGRVGGLKGGPARAGSMTSERRSDIASKAARARWERARGDASASSAKKKA